MMPLMYAILKDARADLEEASKRIDEGKRVVNEYSRMHNLNMYDGVELRNSNRKSALVAAHPSTDLLEDCRKLLVRFKYAWDMMPLVYAILKDARADLEEASRRIVEGRIVVNEYSRMHNHNVYDGFELRNSTRKYGLSRNLVVTQNSRQCTDLLKDCQKLLEKFKYPWEMMPLMYAILKNAHADLEEASNRIDEGQYNSLGWLYYLDSLSLIKPKNITRPHAK
nr:unnamed protein product [Callosobruchus analis]